MTKNLDTVYLSYGQYVYAINLENGSLKWRFPGEKPDRALSFYAPPALTADGDVIVGGYDHKLYKLNAASGEIIWDFEGAGDRYVAGALVTQVGIFAPNSDGKLYALDQNKAQLWQPFGTNSHLWATPTTDERCECIYLPSMDRHLYVLEAATGTLLWKSPDLGGALVAEPTYDEDGSIYLGTFGSEMLAIKAENGNIIWRKATNGWVWSGVRIVDGKLYFGDLKGTFYILDAATGEMIKQEQLDGAIVGTPAYDGKATVYLGTEAGTLYAYRLDGSRVWMKSISAIQKDNKEIGGKLYAPVIAEEDLILVAPVESAALVLALNGNGETKWIYYPEN